MSGFSAGWLDHREPADADARNAALAVVLATALARDADSAGTLKIVDLGCGTGANLRWLAPRLSRCQDWLLLDNDPALLSVVPPRLAHWAGQPAPPAAAAATCMALGSGRTATWRKMELAAGELPVAEAHLVTASALADLVSRDWLSAFATACRAARNGHGAAVLLTLCFDGRLALHPSHPDDGRVRDTVNAHQRRDKGFGSALGPTAAAAAGALLSARGFRVSQARSDWRLGAGSNMEMQRELLRGWHQACTEQQGHNDWLDDWLQWRLGQLTRPGSRIRVGHVDLLALPPG